MVSRASSGRATSSSPLPNPRRDLLRSEPEVLRDLFVWGGVAERVDADHERVVVHVFVPAVGAAGFDGHDLRAVAEDFVLVVNRLTIEEVEAGGGHDARTHAFAAQQVRGLD